MGSITVKASSITSFNDFRGVCYLATLNISRRMRSLYKLYDDNVIIQLRVDDHRLMKLTIFHMTNPTFAGWPVGANHKVDEIELSYDSKVVSLPHNIRKFLYSNIITTKNNLIVMRPNIIVMIENHFVGEL